MENEQIPTPDDDRRAVFRTFPPELQRAMRQAGAVERGTPEQWRYPVLRGWFGDGPLGRGYRARRAGDYRRGDGPHWRLGDGAMSGHPVCNGVKAPAIPPVRPPKARNGMECYP